VDDAVLIETTSLKVTLTVKGEMKCTVISGISLIGFDQQPVATKQSKYFGDQTCSTFTELPLSFDDEQERKSVQ
jgi:hypothetical protein